MMCPCRHRKVTTTSSLLLLVGLDYYRILTVACWTLVSAHGCITNTYMQTNATSTDASISARLMFVRIMFLNLGFILTVPPLLAVIGGRRGAERKAERRWLRDPGHA